MDIHDVSMSIGDHLDELRKRIVTCLFVLFGAFAMTIVDQNFYMTIILEPHKEAMLALNHPTTIQVLRYEETFFCYLKVSIIAALIITMPFTLYQLWEFIASGLYSHEKRYVMTFFPFAIIFFATGIVFGYSVLIPLGLRFLGGYGGENTIQMGFTLSSYVSLFFVLTFVCGVIFELPLVMLVLVKAGLLNTRFFVENWRHSFLAAFVIAALLTPPDVVTQLLMAFPIVSLYFSGIFLCSFSDRLQDIRRQINIGIE
ncbi:twin-arginine translocase subunit TatC [Candidatus Uabimicrobium amorphum]|uniref:Sec-independent protein translocase protein TatC n=1 Tax=Uabimicrobium amorphum TaxID=2596890 RepID=A0A5S9F372_UABAM|nr:twin-arginine translocase subunit TatC [Candidatus Uabimicrobium amorphum]BBM83229.1 Sec-independent protein translocase protein TatC [Candidatus Uabimicrobium amorphum]